MCKMYFKVVYGYNPEDYIEINEDEVVKAYYCFLEKKDSVFSGGAIRGSQIIWIKPDYHRTMSWNRGHKLDDYDFSELRQKGIDTKMQNYLETGKDKAYYIMKENRPELLNQNFELPKITENNFTADVKSLADSKRI